MFIRKTLIGTITIIVSFFCISVAPSLAETEVERQSWMGGKSIPQDNSFENLMNRGGNFHENGEREKALPLYKKAYKVAQSNGDLRQMANAMDSLSTIYDQSGKKTEANQLTLKALAIREKLVFGKNINTAWNEREENWFGTVNSDSNPRDWEAYESALAMAANVEREKKNFEMECSHRQKLIFIRRIRLGQFHSLTGYGELEYAKALENNNDNEAAMVEYQKALRILKQTDTRFSYGQVERNIGDLYKKMGHPKKGDDWLKQAKASISLQDPNSAESQYDTFKSMKLPPKTVHRRKHPDELTSLPHYGRIAGITYSPTNNLLAVTTTANSGGVFLWSTKTMECIGGFSTGDGGGGWASFTTNNKLLVATQKGVIFSFDLSNLKLNSDKLELNSDNYKTSVTQIIDVKPLSPETQYIIPSENNGPYPMLYVFSASPGGNRFAWSFFTSSGSDFQLHFANLNDLEGALKVSSSASAFSSVAFSDDEAYMASIGPQRKGCVWNVDVALTNHVDPLSPIHYFGDGRKFPQAITFLNKGKEIAVSDNDGTVAIYSTKSGKKLNEYKGHKLAVNATAFARDRDLFVTGSSDWTVKVWNRSRVTELASLQSHGASVTTVAITNDGTQAASGGTDGQVIIWELKNFK